MPELRSSFDELLRRLGEIADLELRERVHRWGRVFDPAELLKRAVGGPLDAEPYVAYLREKVDALGS